MLKLKSRFSVYWHLSSIEFFYWFAAAFGGYLTVFLQRQGRPADLIGFLYAICSVVSILASPFWGMMADRARSIRKILLFCLITGASLWALTPVSSVIGQNAVPFIFVIIPLGAFFRSPYGSLVEAFVVQRADMNGVTFSHVRLWGSISYAVMSLLLSRILPLTGVEISFYFYGIAFIPFLMILWKMNEPEEIRRTRYKSFKSMGFGRLLKNYYFITFLFFYLLVGISTSAAGSFLPLLINAIGDDPARLGLIGGYNALLEIPILLLIPRLRKKFPLPNTIIAGVFLLSLGTFLYSRADSLFQIVLIQTLHGLGGGLLIGSITSYVYSLAPEGLNSTAHTLCGAAASIASIIGNLAGGVLIVTFGIYSFYRVSSLILFCAMLFFITTLRAGKKRYAGS